MGEPPNECLGPSGGRSLS